MRHKCIKVFVDEAENKTVHIYYAEFYKDGKIILAKANLEMSNFNWLNSHGTEYNTVLDAEHLNIHFLRNGWIKLP